MKHHTLLLGIALALASPLTLAQSSGATPATPATPAVPPSDSAPTVDQPTTDDKGATRTGVRSKNGHAVGAANPNSGHGSAAGTATSDFASFDANGDGKLSQSEISSDAALGGRFKELDKNSDGSISKAEYEASLKATPPQSSPNDAKKRIPGN